jgi:outer membrane lipoprotein carrier protein
MKKILFIGSMIALFTLASALQLNDVIDKTNANYAGLKTFYTKFTQTMCDEAAGICRIFDGEIYFLKPNFFRMTISDPEQVLVGDSASLWIYMPKEKRAIRQALTQMPFAINPEIFLKDYDEHFNAALTKEEDRYCEITLTPKEDSEIFSKIVIIISIPDYKIANISIVDQGGAENKFEFENTEINKKINKKIFQFNPPKGTEIIEQ